MNLNKYKKKALCKNAILLAEIFLLGLAKQTTENKENKKVHI